MFIRTKKNGSYEYLQLVNNQRVDGQVRQRVLGTLGRRDLLEQADALGGLAASLAKFTRRAVVLAEHRAGQAEVLSARCRWPSSTPPVCTSRAKAARRSASTDTPRTIGRTSSRWWWGWC